MGGQGVSHTDEILAVVVRKVLYITCSFNTAAARKLYVLQLVFYLSGENLQLTSDFK